MRAKTERMQFRVDPALKRRAERVARLKRTTLSAMVTEFLLQEVESEEAFKTLREVFGYGKRPPLPRTTDPPHVAEADIVAMYPPGEFVVEEFPLGPAKKMKEAVSG